ncbi:MAG: hypothetical protein SO146_05390, partial [Eubacteriales bacterium]|nr:hypothetical protein [Eubacteriales bacterium]
MGAGHFRWFSFFLLSLSSPETKEKRRPDSGKTSAQLLKADLQPSHGFVFAQQYAYLYGAA